MMATRCDLNLASNMFGALNGELRVRLNAVIRAPTVESWENAYSIVIGSDGWMTLWQAVCELDSSYMDIGKVTDIHGSVIESWRRIPDAATIIEAINYATH